MKLWIIVSTSALALVTLPAFAQSQVTIDQSSQNNSAVVDQSGSVDPSVAEIIQTGSAGGAFIRQANEGRAADSPPDSARIEQRGVNDIASARQTTAAGQYGSRVEVTQLGDFNVSSNEQIGGDHLSTLHQISDNNQGGSFQHTEGVFGAAVYDGNISTILQAGEGGHTAAVEQYGQDDISDILQTGADNSALVIQGNVFTTSRVVQTGIGNSINLQQPFHSGSDIEQHGTNGSVTASLTGFLNVRQTDTSDGAVANVNQTGSSGVLVNIEQRGAGYAEVHQEGGLDSTVDILQQEASTASVSQGSVASHVSINQFGGSAGASATVDQGTRTGEILINQKDAASANVSQSGLGGYAFIDQDGGSAGSTAVTSQSGTSNQLVLHQRAYPAGSMPGPENSEASIEQIGEAHHALVFQQGASAETVAISQAGSANEVSTWQGGGGGHSARVHQGGSDNFALVAQGGKPDDSSTPLDPIGAEYADSRGNVANVDQGGIGNTAVLTQIGFDGVVDIRQPGNGNAAYVVQQLNGFDNLATVIQSGNDNRTNLTQSGSDQIAWVQQVTNGNVANLTQSGSGNFINVTQ